MRINKYLASKGYSTRRGGDELVLKKRVSINGKTAKLGDTVNEHDVVEVRKGKEKTFRYVAYHKPVGVITHSPQRGEKDIKGSVPVRGVFPVGRLDKQSSGLIILTDDGRITDRLLNPKFEHEKEYIVTTTRELSPSFKRKMEAGVNIEGYVTKKCTVAIVGESTFTIVLTEGKKHQIRRMCSALHREVKSLKRTRIMNIKLGNLQPGAVRAIEGKELETFFKELGWK